MNSRLLTEELWAEIQPLLPRPKRRRRRHPGRKRIDDRRVLTGILFVLKTGIPWDDVPAELGFGSGKTMKRRLHVWTRRGVWNELLAVMHAKLNAAGRLDWSRALVDSAAVKAPSGGQETGPNPTDRRKRGSKHHIVTDAGGVPLAVITTAANRHDVTQLIPLVDAIKPIRGRVGRPRRRPRVIQGDRAYDSKAHRR